MKFFSNFKKDNIFAVFLISLSATFCFAGYELFRSSSESVFLSHYPASYKVYALSIVPIFLILLIHIYARLLDLYGSKIAFIFYFIFSSVMMLLFYVGCVKRIAFFTFSVLVFKESYVVILSEMYWSYINSALSIGEAKLLNGYIAGFGATGSVLGGLLVTRLANKIDSEYLFIIGSFFVIIAGFLMYLAYLRYEPVRFERDSIGKEFVKTIFKNRVLTILFITVFISQIISTLSDLTFTEYVKREISDKNIRTSFLGYFWTTVNIFSFTFQFILTPFILKNFGIKFVLVSVPIIHLFSSIYCFINPSLFSSGIVFLLFKSLDYSIYRAAKETLYIPFNYDIRYKTKQVIDAFNYRFAKGLISIFLSIFSLSRFYAYVFFMPFISFLSLLWGYMFFRTDLKDYNQ